MGLSHSDSPVRIAASDAPSPNASIGPLGIDNKSTIAERYQLRYLREQAPLYKGSCHTQRD